MQFLFLSWDKDKQEKVQAGKRYASEKMNQSRKGNEAMDSAASEGECVTLKKLFLEWHKHLEDEIFS